MFRQYYLRIIRNIRNTDNPFEILKNVDNLNWILEKEKFEKRKISKQMTNSLKRLDKTTLRKILKDFKEIMK